MSKMNYWSKSFKCGYRPKKEYRHHTPLSANQRQAMMNVGIQSKHCSKWTAAESEKYQAELRRLNNAE